MVRGWAEQHGIRTLSYINPFFSEYVDPNAPIPNVTAAAAAAASTSPTGRNLYREGIQHGYFVNKTGAGPKGAVGAYSMHSGSIEFCMLDTTNPAARRWMKDVMKVRPLATHVCQWRCTALHCTAQHTHARYHPSPTLPAVHDRRDRRERVDG